MTTPRTTIIASLCAILALTGCDAPKPDAGGDTAAAATDTNTDSAAAIGETGANAPSATEAENADWRDLFDGKTLRGWVGRNGAPIGKQWQIIDGELALTGAGGGDILTEEQFEDFELSIEWKISKQGNSGIYYRVEPGTGHAWLSGPEYQVLDDDDYPGLEKDSHTAGSVFDVYAPSEKAANPAMAFNRSRILVRDNHVEHWLNGKKIVAFEFGSKDWTARVKASKFASVDAFGKAQRGRIGLQDHGHKVWYRNIKIRQL